MLRKIKNFKHLLGAVIAACYFRFPCRRLFVIGVTGTDGKTTTVHLIGHLLNQSGFKVATVSTIGAWLGEEKIQTGFHVTTPSHWLIQKLMRKIADQGYTHVVLEATSHGLDQHRLFGCNFKVGVITNVTHDHLDYHKTYSNYLKAKSKLFKGVKMAVLNKDDKSFELLYKSLKRRRASVMTYGLKSKADLTPRRFHFQTQLPGEHNQYNCLAAIAVARNLGVPDEKIRKSLGTFAGIPGRMEEVRAGQNFKVYVDFAHTPAAFEKVLKTVKDEAEGEVIHVFGCTGNRDKEKRPLMGAVSAKLSDKIILTHEDTYSENPQKIVDSIETGVIQGGKVLDKNYWKVLDRKEAIRKALSLAGKGDVVLVTGVGHQQSLNIGGKEIPWNDPEVIKGLLSKSAK